jgi:hypothetical protein
MRKKGGPEFECLWRESPTMDKQLVNPYTRVQSDIINCKIDQPDIRVQSNVL